MPAGVEIKDLGIGRIKKMLGDLAQHKITLGVQGSEAREKHPNAKAATGVLAAWLHFGTAKMRKRPYVDVAIVNLRKAIPNPAKQAVRELIDGRASTVVAALSPIGKAGAAMVKDAIDQANSWVDWDLSAQTIARKGHDRHLIDTGTVRDATSYAVRHVGAVVESGKAPG